MQLQGVTDSIGKDWSINNYHRGGGLSSCSFREKLTASVRMGLGLSSFSFRKKLTPSVRMGLLTIIIAIGDEFTRTNTHGYEHFEKAKTEIEPTKKIYLIKSVAR